MNEPAVNTPAWWQHYLSQHWDANDGAGQTRHFMQRLVEELRPPERQWLASGHPRVLDWGCAHGEGVAGFARAFPNATVEGLDIASTAVAEARRRHPGHTFHVGEGTEVPDGYDVVLCSNTLEHFRQPLPVLERLAAAAKMLLLVLVPYAEEPLCEYHFVRLDEHSFPPEVAGRARIACDVIDVEPRYWPGQQLLVTYASATYLAERVARQEASIAATTDTYERSLVLRLMRTLDRLRGKKDS
ncbi:MAG TPA: class I SAM-dependent methyltransferase [bacterium]|nr:class I SAM-dependent methyltransferase [bacterium]